MVQVPKLMKRISCREENLLRNRYAQMSKKKNSSYTVYLSKRGLRDKYTVNNLRIDMTNYLYTYNSLVILID